MRLLLVWSAFCVMLVSGLSAGAQIVSLYGLVGGTRSSDVSVNAAPGGGGWGGAYGGGVTFNFLNLHVVKLGLDARGTVGNGTTKTDTAELSLRLGIQPPVLRLKPYLQIGVGYLAPTVPAGGAVGPTYTQKDVSIGGHVGIDKPLVPLIDWRVVDVGVAHGYQTGPSATGGASLFSIATGLVVHF